MNDEFVDKKGIRWNPKEMLNNLAQKHADLIQEYDVLEALHKVAVRERDYERTLCDNYKKDYYDLRSLYEGVLSRINKLEDDTRAAIEFADIAEDDRGTEMILEFCEDITKLVGE